MQIDFDLFVIDPKNKETTPEQLRECIYDALTVLDQRTRPKTLSEKYGISLCRNCWCMTHTLAGNICGKCKKPKHTIKEEEQ